MSGKGLLLLAVLISGAPGYAAVFGSVVAVRGTVADVALDERRQKLYIANFSANRVEVMNTSDQSLGTPMDVGAPPSAIALSPDGRYLLVGIDSNFKDSTARGGFWIFDLDGGVKQQVALPDPVLSVAFGAGRRALLVTTTGLLLLDPATARTQAIPVEFTANTVQLPGPFGNFPTNFVQAATGVSGDGRTIFVLASANPVDIKGAAHTVAIEYAVDSTTAGIGLITSAPALGPRVVTADQTGQRFLTGWVLWDQSFVNRAQFPAAKGELNVGMHAWDYTRDRIFGQIPAPGDGAVLHVFDTDNLTVRERVQMPQNLAGRSVWSSDGRTLYAASVSGVTVFPISDFDRAPRVTALQEDMLFQDNTCDHGVLSQTIDIVDPNGAHVDFGLSLPAGTAGVRLSQTTGVTPAKVRIDVDPTVYQNTKGTTSIALTLSSAAAINLPPSIRILINTHDANQYGRIVNVPGKITDILADRARNRLYLTRQDKNLILVYDAVKFSQIATLRTGNTPVGMAITTDQRYLIVGNDNSQIASVFDLDTLQPSGPIVFPDGHYPRSVAVSNNAILATARVVSGDNIHKVDKIDLRTRVADALPSLGVYENKLVSPDGILAESRGNNSILLTLPDGNVVLYDAIANTFVASRKDFTALSGAVAAFNDDRFLADNHILDTALVPIGSAQTTTGGSSGAGVAGGYGLRTTAGLPNAPGTIERIDLATLETFHGVLTTEAPLLAKTLAYSPVGQIGQTILPFTRTLAVPADQSSIVLLTVSGLTVLSPNFDAPVSSASTGVTPVIAGVTNAADGGAGIAPGGLVQIAGTNLASSSAAFSALPLPTALSGTCATLGNTSLPLFNVSASAIFAQLPLDTVGKAPLIVRTPDGVSSPFNVTVQNIAPAVFQKGTAGDVTGLPTVIREKNGQLVSFSNPLHPDENIAIYLTGLGLTTPRSPAGSAAPANPLAVASVPVEVSVGPTKLSVTFAGLVPGEVGVYQINAYVPKNLGSAAQTPLVISAGGASTSLEVRAVNP